MRSSGTLLLKFSKRKRSSNDNASDSGNGEDDDVATIISAIDDEALRENNQQEVLAKKTKHVALEPPPISKESSPYVGETLKAETLEEYILKEPEAIFLKRLQAISAANSVSEILQELPTQKDLYDYLEMLQKTAQPAWYRHSKLQLETTGYNIPVLPVLCRRYIAEFLRECDPRAEWERPCCNAECESQKRGGFRCRELLMPAEYARVLETDDIEERVRVLPPMVNLCYLCHLFFTNFYYWQRLFHGSTEDNITVIHSFSVCFDVPGEYAMRYLLMGDDKPCGIFGPFPLYNINNYQAHVDARGINYWVEADKLVFH